MVVFRIESLLLLLLTMTGSVLTLEPGFEQKLDFLFSNPNPLALYCMEMGGEYRIISKPSGQSGICVFPDGTEYDAWNFYSSKCSMELNFTVNCSSKFDHLSNPASSMGSSFLEAASQSSGDELESGSILAYFDWRNFNGKDYTTPVKDQGLCGSCWAFAVIGAFESVFEITREDPDLNPDFSEQDLISCSSAGNCGGGYLTRALEYLAIRGVVEENCFPYMDYNCLYPSCLTNRECSEKYSDCEFYSISYFGKIEGTLNDIKRHLVSYGPLVALMKIDGYFDSNGIFRCDEDVYEEKKRPCSCYCWLR